jgi:OmpA-OmpF porin, OOP family
MRIAFVALAGALALQAGPCVADSRFYVAPIVNGVRADGDRTVDDDAAFTLAAGAEVHPRWNLELNLFRGQFDGIGGDDLDLDAAGLNALRVFRRDARVAPYVLVGLGAQRNDRRLSDSSTGLYEDAGLGLLGTLRKSPSDGRALLLRVEARARHDDTDAGSRVDYLFGLGLQYAFGSRSPASKPAPVSAAPAVAASAVAAPAPPAPDADSDDDGVVDPADDCPGTSRETRTDARGCELREEIRLPRVTFESNSDRLQPESFATLDQAIETLRRNPDLRIEVAGYTDSRGSDAYNLALSQRRAEAVRRYLVDHGASNTLTARGYGESDAVADNGTETGRAENRRVVLRILAP